MTPFDLAQRFVGIKELSGAQNHPIISFSLSLCGFSLDAPDEIPWCAAWINFIAWMWRLPRSKSAAARSWLGVGMNTNIADAVVGYDIVVLKRGTNPEQGHVGFFAGWAGGSVLVLGGNQQNSVSIAAVLIKCIRSNTKHIIACTRLLSLPIPFTRAIKGYC